VLVLVGEKALHSACLERGLCPSGKRALPLGLCWSWWARKPALPAWKEGSGRAVGKKSWIVDDKVFIRHKVMSLIQIKWHDNNNSNE
jgi:hypothetical protein